MHRPYIVKELLKCKHKPDVNPKDWHRVKDNLIHLAEFTMNFAKDRNLPLVFTSIIREKLDGSVSKTHEQGRAFDISTKGWSDDHIKHFLTIINSSFNVGAISLSDGKEKEAIYHDIGLGAHIHVQCKN